MLVLYHFWLSPQSRKLRVQLREKSIEVELREERYWERRREFLALNPVGEVPVLLDGDNLVLSDSQAIAEYLEETQPRPGLLGGSPRQRAETRRLVAWFDRKFEREVSHYLLREKVVKRLNGEGGPDSEVLRAAAYNLDYHLQYVGYLAERRNYLAGDEFSLADIAAAAHLSCIDYLSDVAWERHGEAKAWYAKVKSRPSFRAILADHIVGMSPPKHYANLDF
ncbi:MAG: glutathione S-transferase family protein [Alphaproteobacteria bacterium]|nr:glutathione S-transferase family protein [Alphaproteobacteria bacterium]